MAKFGKRSLDNLKGVHPSLILLMSTAICDTPIDFTIVEGVRTKKRQQELYLQGRTNPGNIVTYADGVRSKSNHQIKADGFGHAVDIYPYIDGGVKMNDVASLRVIANHIKNTAKRIGIKITWGGDWTKPFDPPHFQL